MSRRRVQTFCDCGLADASIEGSIINDYAKAVIGEPIVDASGDVEGVEITRITHDEDTHDAENGTRIERTLSRPVSLRRQGQKGGGLCVRNRKPYELPMVPGVRSTTLP